MQEKTAPTACRSPGGHHSITTRDSVFMMVMANRQENIELILYLLLDKARKDEIHNNKGKLGVAAATIF